LVITHDPNEELTWETSYQYLLDELFLSVFLSEDESLLPRTSSRTWLNASFNSARVIDTMMDGGWLIEVGCRRQMG
jgi:hypothetical protein